MSFVWAWESRREEEKEEEQEEEKKEEAGKGNEVEASVEQV